MKISYFFANFRATTKYDYVKIFTLYIILNEIIYDSQSINDLKYKKYLTNFLFLIFF